MVQQRDALLPINAAVSIAGESQMFGNGDRVRIACRWPIGHYRVPLYIRGRTGKITDIVQPAWLDHEQEGFGRNAGIKKHYYRIAFLMSDLWLGYKGFARDELRIDVFESWLEGV